MCHNFSFCGYFWTCFSFKARVVFESSWFKRRRNVITKIRCNGCTAYQNVCVISVYLQPTSYFQAAIRLLLNFQESLLFVLIPSQLSPRPRSTTLNIDALLPEAGPHKLCFHSHCYTCRHSTRATADEAKISSTNYSHYSLRVYSYSQQNHNVIFRLVSAEGKGKALPLQAMQAHRGLGS